MLHVSSLLTERAADDEKRMPHLRPNSCCSLLPVMLILMTGLLVSSADPAVSKVGASAVAVSLPSSNLLPSAAALSASNSMLMKSGAMLRDVFSAPRLLDAGTAISLKCTATGTPLPQVTWTLDGNSLHESTSRLSVGDFVTKSSEVISFVNMTAITTEDGGVYSCTAANEISSASHSGRIDVRGDPTVRSMRERVAVDGAPLLLNCPFSGHPIDEVFWEHSKLPARYLSDSTVRLFLSRNTVHSFLGLFSFHAYCLRILFSHFLLFRLSRVSLPTLAQRKRERDAAEEESESNGNLRAGEKGNSG